MKTRPPVEPVVPEILEYKLEYTPDLRCEKQTDLVPVCHNCKSCILSWKTFSTREWFVRASHASQRQFLVGIIKRFKSQDLLNYAWNLLRPTNAKDFTYSRSCVSSSFMVSSTLDRALDPQKLEQSMASLWKWFLHASFWTKANYLLLLLQMCDSQLLLMAASLIRILLSQDGNFTLKKEESALTDETVVPKDQAKSASQVTNHLASQSACFSSGMESCHTSERSGIFAHLHVQRAWSKESDQLSGDISEGMDDDEPRLSVVLNVTTSTPISPQKAPSTSNFKDFIRCLPIHLSKRILRMLDQKSLHRCSSVSLHWDFLVKELKKDVTTNRSRRSGIAFLQGMCPKRPIGNYAKIVNVAIPQINQNGDIIPVRSRSKIHKEFEHLHKAYHGQLTDSIKLEERNVFCSSYNVRVLIDRMWTIFFGTCVKIFNGHSGSITCLDMYNNRFVSGSKDCTAKMWDIDTGKCLKTFAHKGIVWAAKINETHVVSCCDRGAVKVWHAETFMLIKTLEGHLGPVKCLSFDNWHLVSGSNDGYVLGWSMMGKHKRCLMAFRHPMEVLDLGFLYLRVISGCADGKIRIFNFLTGTCLRVMRANSRGNPVVSFCIAENKLLINAQGSVILFQFEEVDWDHTQTSERLMKRKDKSKVEDIPFRIKPSPQSHSERQKRAKKNNWKLYSRDTDGTMLSQQSTQCSNAPPAPQYEIVKTPPPRARGSMAALPMKSDKKQRLSFARKLESPESVPTLKGYSDDETGHDPPALVPFGQNAEAFIKYIKQKRPLGLISNDQILLTISTMHHAYGSDQVSANMAYNMNIKDAWGPDHLQKNKSPKAWASSSAKQEKMDPCTQLKRLKVAGGIVGMERISTPYETKTLQLNLKNSLLVDTVKSCIPPPSITRSKSCTSLSGEKKVTGRAKIPSPPTTGGHIIGNFTTACGSIKVPRMKIGQPDTETSPRRGKLLFAHIPNPYRMNIGFRLLTTQQMKEYEEEKISEYQANKTKVIANREKEVKSAWLRKIKGLPIDDFIKEGKVAAPELGENVFI
ncbi:CMT1A duplicated region transcript 1 protein isoform X2 [Sceloporus undulatus]|uniref:CMT1A duplicated region transcript 1 protein isoform X2 n=1 Tax=Sceloporus undulatus TaxID=8520 RepID=UPI001C4DC53A|nr:CMT1A duplicated region transcript 1 protein isoform X2 [Sceloporus undulatus]